MCENTLCACVRHHPSLRGEQGETAVFFFFMSNNNNNNNNNNKERYVCFFLLFIGAREREKRILEKKYKIEKALFYTHISKSAVVCRRHHHELFLSFGS